MAFNTLSNRKLFYGVIIIVLIIAVVYQINGKGSQQKPEKVLPAIQENQIGVQAALEKPAHEAAPKQQPQHVPASKAEFSSAQSKVVAPDVWRIGSATTVTPTMRLPAGVSIYESVSVDMENPAYPEPGEQVSVAIPGGERLQVNVETSSTNPNGDYTWRGHLEGHGDEYPIVMTYGSNSVFATVTTPKGSYSMESVNGSGWIYKNPSEFELSKPGSKDYIEIPHDHP